jgi:perosamine synthetase
MINIYEPYLNKKNLKYAHDAIDSTWISSHGKYLNMIKDSLLELNKKKYVLLCNNGTSATHLLAIGLKYKFPKIKNLIVPNNVYVAAWNSFLMNPEFNLIPIDSNTDTWNIDMSKLEELISEQHYTPENTAILIVHNIGNIINVPLLKRKYHDFQFIEDNCEGFLGEYENKPSGSLSLMSSVSFFGNKNITSGEGGALFTDDEELFQYLNSSRTQGSTSKKFIFDKIGYNYRMTNIQASILHGQIESLDEIMEKKSIIFESYRTNLDGVVDFQKIEDNTKHSNWMMGIKLPIDSDKISLNLFQQGIETRPMFPPMSYHAHLEEYAGNERNSKELYNKCIILPSHPNLQIKEVEYISNTIKSSIK